MADHKQPQLNGAYYGPSIPPAEHPHHHRRHRGRGCCCCLLGIFWKLLVTIIVIVALAILIFWLVVQPRAFKFYVSEANLSQFDYTNNTLRYDLVLNFTARNPNKKLSIYYDKVEARALYDDVRFATADVINQNSFRQYTKSTNPMSVQFSGQQVMVVDQTQFDQDSKSGSFNINVRLYFRIRFRLGDYITGDFKPKVKCDLDVPLTSNTTTTAGFQSTKCHVDF